MIFDYSFSFAVKSSVFFSTRRGDFGCSRCICLIAWTFWWNHFWFFLFPVNDSLFLFLSILLLGDVYLRVLRFFIFGAVFSCPGHQLRRYKIYSSSVLVIAPQSMDLFEVLLFYPRSLSSRFLYGLDDACPLWFCISKLLRIFYVFLYISFIFFSQYLVSKNRRFSVFFAYVHLIR